MKSKPYRERVQGMAPMPKGVTEVSGGFVARFHVSEVHTLGPFKTVAEAEEAYARLRAKHSKSQRCTDSRTN